VVTICTTCFNIQISTPSLDIITVSSIIIPKIIIIIVFPIITFLSHHSAQIPSSPPVPLPPYNAATDSSRCQYFSLINCHQLPGSVARPKAVRCLSMAEHVTRTAGQCNNAANCLVQLVTEWPVGVTTLHTSLFTFSIAPVSVLSC
jgi:hypothetical protein